MFSYFRRKRNERLALTNILIAASRKESWERRFEAIYALKSLPASPAVIRAVSIIVHDEEEPFGMREQAVDCLRAFGTPDSFRVLLELVTSDFQHGHVLFTEALSALRWGGATLSQFADEALVSLRLLGRRAILWTDNALLLNVRSMIQELGIPAARVALEELDELLREQRTMGLPALLKIALESTQFDDAAFAVAEIAALGSDDAHAALVTIRRQPLRHLEHSYKKDDPGAENLSLRLFHETLSSSKLGEALSGPQRARWDAAMR
jgi:hypothetical protein